MENRTHEEFVEKIGLAVEHEGYPRIAGRIYAFLVLTEGAHSLDDLAQALQISRASASTNARLLERDGVITRTSSPGDRRDYYQVTDDHWERMFEQALRRVTRFHRAFAEAAAGLPEGTPAVRRVRDGERFYALLMSDLESRLDRWRESWQGNSDAGKSPAQGDIDEA